MSKIILKEVKLDSVNGDYFTFHITYDKVCKKLFRKSETIEHTRKMTGNKWSHNKHFITFKFFDNGNDVYNEFGTYNLKEPIETELFLQLKNQDYDSKRT